MFLTPSSMSRLVKKVLQPFSSSSRSHEKIPRAELESTEKSFVPPPVLRELEPPPLTGDPVTLAIIGGGQRGKASIQVIYQYIYYINFRDIVLLQLRSQPLSLLQDCCNCRTSSPNSPGVCDYISCSCRACLCVPQGTTRRIRRSR